MPLYTSKMLASAQSRADNFEPANKDAGMKLVETLQGPAGELIYSGTHVVNADQTLTTEKEQWHNDMLAETNEPAALQLLAPTKAEMTLLAGDAAKAGLEAAKLAWDIIKSSKATAVTQDVKSSVLSSKDTDPMSYPGAREGNSGIYKWVINDAFTAFGTINYITVRIKLQGSYRASPAAGSNIPPGHYLPSIYFNVVECTVNAPCHLDGTANLENPTNTGSTSQANASVIAHAKLNGGWLLQAMGISIKFKASGTGGFVLLGKE